jgi:hypothetical protein
MARAPRSVHLSPARRPRRAGQRGQTGAEFFLLGLGILAIATTMTVAVGGWAAATYDQQHSNQALAQQAAPAVTHPSVSFTDFSPVGLYEDCILGVARGLGLSWDGGALGWTSAANPRPRGSDGLNDSKVQAWRDAMSAELGAASSSTAWKACSLPQLSPTVPQSPPAAAETIVVDGQYVTDPNAEQAVGGCGSGGSITGMLVAGNGSSITLYFNGTGAAGNRLTGTLDTSSYAFDGSLTDADGTRHTLRGTFSSNAGVTRFHGVYETPVGASTCGYDFTGQKS